MSFWDFFKSKKSKSMIEKIKEGHDKTKDHLFQELSRYKFQWLNGTGGGRSTRLENIEEKNGKIKVFFKDGTNIDFKLLDDELIKLALHQADFTLEQLKEFAIARKKPKRSVPQEINDEIMGASEEDLIEESKKEARIGNVKISTPEFGNYVESPLQSLLKKQKENLVDLSLSLKVNLPPKALFEVLLSSYDNAEDEILDFAVSKIDIKAIKESIKDAIKKNYYNINESRDNNGN